MTKVHLTTKESLCAAGNIFSKLGSFTRGVV